MQPTLAQLASEFEAKANAVIAAPPTPEKAQLIAERNAAGSAYFRAAYEQQRGSLSHIQRPPYATHR